jgi:hypothetical protein
MICRESATVGAVRVSLGMKDVRNELIVREGGRTAGRATDDGLVGHAAGDLASKVSMRLRVSIPVFSTRFFPIASENRICRRIILVGHP